MGIIHRLSSSMAVVALLYALLFTSEASRDLFASNKTATSAGICAAMGTMHGYKCQELEVRTKDGYILGVQRISKLGGAHPPANDRQPVLLQHGIFMDGLSWMVNSGNASLPMILADVGFDVWIAYTRGTQFSRRHVTLDPSDPKYWSWSWDELAMYDLPAFVDFVFKQTGGQKIHYVGHSMGTLTAMVSFSQGIEVDKVKSAVLLSPIAYLSHMKTRLAVFASKAFLGELVKLLGFAEFNLKSQQVGMMLNAICSRPGVDCYALLSAFTGENCCLNASTAEVFFKNEPQPTSTKNLVHFAQSVRGGNVTKYDYGTARLNREKYGEEKPPAYELSKIPRDLPLFLSYGGEDALSDVTDVQTLLRVLKFHDPDKLSVQYIKQYGHADFIWAINAKDMVYEQVIAFFKRHH